MEISEQFRERKRERETPAPFNFIRTANNRGNDYRAERTRHYTEKAIYNGIMTAFNAARGHDCRTSSIIR